MGPTLPYVAKFFFLCRYQLGLGDKVRVHVSYLWKVVHVVIDSVYNPIVLW